MARPANVFGRDDIPGDLTLGCDVCVVGSGAGGGVVAAELAEAGLDVLVLEEGSYHGTEEFTHDSGRMVRMLYRDGGATIVAGNPPVQFTEGCCVGGSTVINGAMSYRTPERILDRWWREEGIDGIRASEMERYFARVERFISAKPQELGSVGGDNALLRAGAEKKGWKVITNTRNQEHCTGSNNCPFGCPTGAKQSTLVSYLPRALAFGARVYSDCRAERLLLRGKRVVGVAARVVQANGRPGARVTVRARTVVSAAGAIQTPAFLLRSGIRSPSGRLGCDLPLHPNAKVVAMFDQKVEAWKGVHQAYQVREFQDEGVIMAAINLPPGVVAMTLPLWGQAMDDVLGNYNHILFGGVLVEDTTSGRVRMVGGSPVPTYNLCDYDAQRLVRGTALLCEMLFGVGATRIILPFEGAPDLHSVDDVRALFRRPIPRQKIEVLTVHLMGTARMGGDRSRHVCDPSGRVYDTDGLWVADASLFPSPIGVNPMETVMTLATRTAERMIEAHAGRAVA